MRLVILGGSSPFIIDLINELFINLNIKSKCKIIFFGRNRAKLETIYTYANFILSRHRIETGYSTDIEDALKDATIILHQIRYGGYEGRLEDEQFCNRWNLVADETIGPAAFLSVLRMYSELQKTSKRIVDICPEAYVLNITNPISIVTKLLVENGIKNCIGVCELPVKTINHIAQVMELPINEVEWTYQGLNHRGFITSVNYHSHDYTKDYLNKYAHIDFANIPFNLLSNLEAIPMKFIKLLFTHNNFKKNRSKYLMQVSEQIFNQLKHSPYISPSALAKRNTDWFHFAVVPLINALNSEKPSLHAINYLAASGVVEESLARISNDSIDIQHSSLANHYVSEWLVKFVNHDRLFYNAVKDPCFDNIIKVVNADPIINNNHENIAAEYISASIKFNTLNNKDSSIKLINDN